MEIKCLKLSTGFSFLREGRLSDAMGCFVDTLECWPTLAGVVRSNIQQTQRYFQKNPTGYSMVVKVTGEASLAYAGIAIVLKDDGIALNGEHHPIVEGSTGASLARFVAQHPVSKLNDTLASHNSLLLCLMYRLLWKTRVTVQLSNKAQVLLDDFLNNEADAATMAQLALTIQSVNMLLIQHLGHPHGHASIDGVVSWPRKYARLTTICDDLVASGEEHFLQSLFNMAVGRAIQPLELKHFSEQLQGLKSSRLQIAYNVCIGDESKRYVSGRAMDLMKNQLVYIHPEVGDIEPDDIKLPLHVDPRVSILIPVYEKVEYTLACLKSITEQLPKVSFEVIVMDDCSPDGSAKILQQVKNLRVVMNPHNLGFLRSCNNGAKQAKGEYFFFLNNDTKVKTGWLDELVDTFTHFPNCGLAGSKLIYPDGLLQEAGGIVWQDGSAWNYGNRQDPALPQFNYAREVDYVSGAAIMVPAQLFHNLGGFDERYIPAYYEDTDLAMRLREQGKSVIYQPQSEVVHFEGISSGTDTSAGIKAYQVVNREKYLERWKSRLSAHRPNGVEPHLERDRGAKGRVLFIDACTPTPDQDSGSIDIFNLMKMFVEMGWAVTFIPEDNYAYMPKYTAALQRMGVQAEYHPHITSVDEHITPYGASYDLVMSFRPMVTHKHIKNLRKKCPNAKIVFNTVDLHFLRLEREAKLKKDPSIANEGLKLKAIELELMKQADLTTVVSSTEHEMLQKMGLQSVLHLPFSRAVRPSNAPFESRSGLVFVGGFQHNPNVDAVIYFVSAIMPLIRELIPGAVLNIVGSNAPKEVRDLASGDILVHGFVEDLESLMDTMRVNVAPLRYGAGTKGKVIHALANGLPTVATSIAVEGMGLKNMEHVGIADNADDFAKTLSSLYSEKILWESFSSNGLSYAEQGYGIDALKKNIKTKILSLFPGNGH